MPTRFKAHPKRNALVVTAIAMAALYGRTLVFDFTHTDDSTMIVENAATLSHLANLPAMFTRPLSIGFGRNEPYYRPLLTTTIMLDMAWGDLWPPAYHLDNLLLHIVAVFLVWILLTQLGFSSWWATLGTALFATHPGLTEAVVWILGRNDPLMAVGAFGSAWAFFRYLEARRWPYLVAHAVLGLGALLSRENAVALPVLLAGYLLLVAPPDDKRIAWRLGAAWGVVVALFGALWFSALGGQQVAGILPRIFQLLVNAPVLLMQVGKLILPLWLSPLAVKPDTPVWPGGLALVAAAAGICFLHGRDRRLFVWGLAWTVFFLLPTLLVTDDLISEPRIYVPAFGVVLCVITAARAALASASQRTVGAASALALLVLVFFSVRAWSYADDFAGAEAFTAAAVAASPHSALAHLNRGTVLHQAGRLDEAEAHYRTSLELDPNRLVAHNNLAIIYLRRGELSAAEAAIREELVRNPDYDKAHYNLGLILTAEGRPDEAVPELEQAIVINSANLDALAQLVNYYNARGDPKRVEQYLTRMQSLGVRLMPAQEGVASPAQ